MTQAQWADSSALLNFWSHSWIFTLSLVSALDPYQNIIMRFGSDVNSYKKPASFHQADARLCQHDSTDSQKLLQGVFLLPLKILYCAEQPGYLFVLISQCSPEWWQSAAAMEESHTLSQPRVALAARRLRRCLVKSSCARGSAWLTMDVGNQPCKQEYLY